MRKITKILSLDYNIENENVTNDNFLSAPSFSDFDVVIIDPFNISSLWNQIKPQKDGRINVFKPTDGGLTNSIINIMKQRSEESEILLNQINGIIICFLRVPLPDYYYHTSIQGRTNNISIYDWLPNNEYSYNVKVRSSHDDSEKYIKQDFIFSSQTFKLTNRQGKQISEIEKTHPFSNYFTNLKNELNFEAVVNNYAIIKIIKPIAKNKAGEIIAFELPFQNSKLIFIPPPPNSEKKITELLIHCIKNLFFWHKPFNPPHWINKYKFPEEKKIFKKKNKINSDITKLNIKKEELVKSQNYYEILKSLLYTQGKYLLEPAVREAFKIIGFNVLNPDDYNEEYDLYIKDKQLIIVGEMEGSKEQIKVKKFRQLLDYVNDEILKGNECKGILIGNGYMNNPPEERGEQFSESVIRGCNKNNFCMISTCTLYKIVYQISTNNDNKLKDLFKKQIIECKSKFIINSGDGA